MGSLAAGGKYPDASDDTLVLTHPTPSEQEQTWRLNHGEWGGPLDLEAYLKREPFLTSTALAANGGMVHWILTETASTDEFRNVLASCETIRKRVLYAPPPQCSNSSGDGSGLVREGLAYGIGSVYTYPEFRGKKYAARMLRELGVVLKTWPEEEQKLADCLHAHSNGVSKRAKLEAKEAVCSALWSDIGKRFYAEKGWPAYDSIHVEFLALLEPLGGVSSLLERSSSPPGTGLTLAPITKNNIAQLCQKDEVQLRGELLTHARKTGRTAFAFAPDADVFRWHWAREEFIVPRAMPGREASEVRGLIATVATDGEDTYDTRAEAEKANKARIWAIWTRNYGSDAATNAAKNTLYILRLVIDTNDTSSDPKALQLAFDAILSGAMDAARSWNCGTVHLWNPTPVVKDLIAASGVAHRFVDRQMDSIPSMRWYASDESGEKVTEDAVDWIANEKYCWC
ncbi:hypothetical protein F5B22DRAFT_198246 [Xylaria bambusicola]|uniref:uncharacterized protein n=1 Tax=Xylaria bambusicola TaxID=326684 RepID=UPI0020072D91|nr:uncharacterized protein F5B22DRAFT_198246 [Xylaria bambusicola]KAI0515316.1 hypothetical protein F5B22DRAFT_198246 [Xylaria bambusicola]